MTNPYTVNAPLNEPTSELTQSSLNENGALSISEPQQDLSAESINQSGASINKPQQETVPAKPFNIPHLPNEIHILIARQIPRVGGLSRYSRISKRFKMMLHGELYTLATRSSATITAIIWALITNNREMLHFFMSNGSDRFTLRSSAWEVVIHHVSQPATDDVISEVVSAFESRDLLLNDGHSTVPLETISGFPLHWAVRVGNRAVLTTLLDGGAPIEARDPINRRTALHWAAPIGNTPIIRLLLDRGAQRMVLDRSSRTPVDLAWSHRRFGAIILLLGNTPIAHEYRHGRRPVDMMAVHPYDDTACSIMAVLLDRGASVRCGRGDIRTSPLFGAVTCGNRKTVALLLERGGDEAQWPQHVSLYKAAENCGHLEIAYQIMDNASLGFKDYSGNTLLHMAVQFPADDEMVKRVRDLHGRGISLNRANLEGNSPLITAVQCSNRKIAVLLIELGANVNVTDASLRTPLQWAISTAARPTPETDPNQEGYPWTMLVKKMAEAGADVNAQEFGNLRTPLHIAVEFQLKPFVEVLLAANASTGILNMSRITSYELAKKHRGRSGTSREIYDLFSVHINTERLER